MAEPFDTYAEQAAEALGLDLSPEQLAALSAVFFALAPEPLRQVMLSATLLGRATGLQLTEGPPPNSFGSPGTVLIDLNALIVYGPKHAETGWPPGRSLTGRSVGEKILRLIETRR